MIQTVEEAAENYHDGIYPTPGNWVLAESRTQKERQTETEIAFKAGAAWQNERYKDMAEALQAVVTLYEETGYADLTDSEKTILELAKAALSKAID